MRARLALVVTYDRFFIIRSSKFFDPPDDSSPDFYERTLVSDHTLTFMMLHKFRTRFVVCDWWVRWRAPCFYTINSQGETAWRARWWATGPTAETRLGEKKPKPGLASRGPPKNSHPHDSSCRSQARVSCVNVPPRTRQTSQR